MLSNPPARTVPARILLVEDSRLMQETLAEVFREMKHLQLVGMAETAREAVHSFNTLQPHAVILDLGLREGTGFEVLHAIKERQPGCRILVFTSYDSEPYRVRCLAAGADRFFSKPRQYRELVQELARFGTC